MRNPLVGSTILAVVGATLLSEYIIRVIGHAISEEYAGSPAGDAPLMLHGLLAIFVYRPLIAAGLGGAIVLLGWLYASRTNRIPLRAGYKAVAKAAMISGAVSFGWSCFTVVVLHGLLP